MLRRGALAFGVLAAVAAAVVAFAQRDRSPEDEIDAPVARPAVFGGTPAERALVARLLEGLGPHRRIVRVRIGLPPRGYARRGNSRWLTVTVASTDAITSRVQAEWQADMLADAMRRSARSEGLPAVLGFTLHLAFPDGDTAFDGATVLGLETPMRSRSPRGRLVRLLEQSAARGGVRIEEIWFVELDRLGVAARLVTRDPEAFVCEAERRLVALTRDFVVPTRAVAGLFLDVRDEDGDPVLAFGNGYIRVSEDLEDRYPPQTPDRDVQDRYEELCGGSVR